MANAWNSRGGRKLPQSTISTSCVNPPSAVRRAVLVATAALLSSCSDAGIVGQNAETGMARAGKAPAEWTVMVYMNAKNDLEPFAINNFREIAETGSNATINYVVEMGRPDATKLYDDRYGNWSGVKRFLIGKGQVPTADTAVAHVGAHDKIDMGSPQTLTNFIHWAKANYPAKNFALIIWNHGQGYRLQVAANGATSLSELSEMQARSDAQRDPSLKPSSYRSVSSDEDFGSTLYNADVRDAIGAGFAPGQLKLLGFDACSMAMIETAYEMRKLAPLMVASEELEPGPGWRYALFVPKLAAKPTMSPKELGETIVDTYRAGYGNSDATTLSLLDLTKIEAAADRLSEVGALMATKLPAQRISVEAARRTVGSYKPKYTRTTVDAITVLEALRARFTNDPQLVARIDAATAALKLAVVANYASTLRQDEWGSKGISVFFPLNETSFHQDSDSSGYRSDNAFKPISFVHDKQWSTFVRRYVNVQ